MPVFLTHFPLEGFGISPSLRKGAVVTIWNFHRLFDESTGDVKALSLCAYSTIRIDSFSSSSYVDPRWLESIQSAQKSLSEYTLVDAVTMCRVIYQLREKWHFLPYHVLQEYTKKIFEKTKINFVKQSSTGRHQFYAHLTGNRCPTLGNESLFLKEIPHLPTVKEIKETVLSPKLGLKYCIMPIVIFVLFYLYYCRHEKKSRRKASWDIT